MSEQRSGLGAVGVGRGWNDPVDHGRGEGAMRGDPFAERGVVKGAVFVQQLFEYPAVVGQVVAR